MKKLTLVVFSLISLLMLLFFTPATPQYEGKNFSKTGEYEDLAASTFHSFALYGRFPSKNEPYDRYSMDVYRLVVIMVASAIVCGVAYKLLPAKSRVRNKHRMPGIELINDDDQRTQEYSDGSTYFGELKDDQRNGFGTLTYPDGSTNSGMWKDNKMNGQGTLTYSDGSTYVGELRDSKLYGHGKFTTSDGITYDGEWINNKRNGFGTLTYPNGSTNSGMWKENRRMSAPT